MSEDEGRKLPDSRLHTIAGRWHTSGHVIDEPAIPVAGTDTYEVLPGGYFLVHHVDVTVGDKPVRAIEIIGEPDAVSGGFLARSFDNDGNTELMHVTIDDHVFHFTGGAEVASAAQTDASTARIRSTLTIAEDGQSMSALWERSEDGSNWQRWMDISFRRGD
ncbi:MAG TPA: DUF1579 family protein [Gaiellaceae bacterium]|nr:DUF1579 family protein [Gaiellaceae bacterium]